MINVHRIESGPVDTNTYVAYNTDSRLAVLFDAPPESLAQITEFVDGKGCSVAAIILTHTHWDHTADCAALVERFQSPVYVHRADEYRLTNPMEHTIWPLPFIIPAVKANMFMEHGQQLKLGDGIPDLEVLHTPGHTEGGVCLVSHQDRWVMVGDTLFEGSVGRTDLPGGDMGLLIESIHENLMVLPDDYTVYPGHGNPTTIGNERILNQFLQ